MEGMFEGKNPVCVNQARVGIYLGVQALLQRTEKRGVVMSPYTIFDVVNMVIAAGGVPQFADVEVGTCNLDLASVKKTADENTALVLVTHLHGLAADLPSLREFCDQNGLALVEDAAQSLGTVVSDRPVGTFGDVGVFSFGMMKNVNGLYGGMLVTPHQDIANDVRQFQAEFEVLDRRKLLGRAAYGFLLAVATHPIVFRVFTYWLFKLGFLYDIGAINSISKSERNPVSRASFPESYRRKMSALQAELVSDQLASVMANASQRCAAAQRYFDGLKDIQEIVLPPDKRDGSHTYMAFPIQVKDREGLLTHLFRNQRDCAAQHIRNCAELKVFQDYERDCPNAAAAAKETLLLPTYPGYSDSQVDANIAAIRSFYNS